ncbi:MAG: chemotaxis protein CheD [Coriobacteriia bacterium]|nr:chemotaxis protein CheD [Coriobacteriia bacterium]
MGVAPLAGPAEPHFIEVGVGAVAFGEAPDTLMTPALGSCVGVAVWDPARFAGGLAHVMLPEPCDSVEGDLDRFASYAVPLLADTLHRGGSARRRLVAKIAGGAAMFAADTMLCSIGRRNVDAVKHQLALLRIPVVAEDTGGGHARTLELHLDSGLLVVRSYQFGLKEL